MLLTLEEYAEKHGVAFSTVRSLVNLGKLKTEGKLNNRWYVDANTPYPCNKRNGYSFTVTKDPLYSVWKGMCRRCNDPTQPHYKYYGGRGISVCEEWTNNPEAFIIWARAHGWQKGLQIDRINNDGNYCPDNCRCVTPKENCQNKGKYRKRNTIDEYLKKRGLVSSHV